jgi:exonuclease VII large subunit
MQNIGIAKLGLAMAVIGIAGLFAVDLLWTPEELLIRDIDSAKNGLIVSVEAEIARTSVKDGNVFWTLTDNGSALKAVVWKSVAHGTDVYSLKEGDFVRATGQIANYRGEIEMVVSKVGA